MSWNLLYRPGLKLPEVPLSLPPSAGSEGLRHYAFPNCLADCSQVLRRSWEFRLLVQKALSPLSHLPAPLRFSFTEMIWLLLFLLYL